MEYINIASIRTCTEAEGPGKRFALWVQGCNKRCKGCCNPEMQKIEKKNIVLVSDIEKIIENSYKDNSIEGISIIGGEPMLQAKGLSELAKWCQNKGLSVLVFSGYTYEELVSIDKNYINDFLKYIDVLVDGEFLEDEYDYERDWVGSKNQKIWYLTQRYSNNIEKEKGIRQMEILIKNDVFQVNGWPFEEYNGK